MHAPVLVNGPLPNTRAQHGIFRSQSTAQAFLRWCNLPAPLPRCCFVCGEDVRVEDVTRLTAPFSFRRETTICAEIDEAGEVVPRVEPCDHGDALSAGAILALYDFGMDLLDDLRRSGFRQSYRVCYRSNEMGYAAAIVAFVARSEPVGCGFEGGRPEVMTDRIAIVVPCYRVSGAIVGVVRSALAHADAVFCVDDACPEHSGERIQQEIDDARVQVLFNESNLGVGGAVKAGYRSALAAGYRVIVKLDGDGQMDAAMIPLLVQPILDGESDYCKGNRFYDLAYLKSMPVLRLFGNSLLSLLTKVSSGYWQTMDPTNGFTAIGSEALVTLPLDRVSNGYFFESDMLFRLNVSRAVVTDVPMRARYGGEQSSLRITRVIGPFLLGNTRNLFKRIFYNYFLRDFNVGSLQLILGLILLGFGATTGIAAWNQSIDTGIPATAGTVMLSGLPVIVGFQLLLSFLHYDIQNTPKQALGRFRFGDGGH